MLRPRARPETEEAKRQAIRLQQQSDRGESPEAISGAQPIGLMNSLLMGLGLRDRTPEYYQRTGYNIGQQRGRAARDLYDQQTMEMRPRAGLFSFLRGDSGGSERGFFPQLLGYRDNADMSDRGGRYASGGQYRGGGSISLLGNLADAISGVDVPAFQYAPEIEAIMDQEQGAGMAEHLRQKEPDQYRRYGESILSRQQFRGGFF